MTWTSQERVNATLQRREPNCVPVAVQRGLDFYLNLKAHLKLDFDEPFESSCFREVVPHTHVYAALGWDMVSINLCKPRRTSQTSSIRQTGLCMRSAALVLPVVFWWGTV
jgi:hypothetical protein